MTFGYPTPKRGKHDSNGPDGASEKNVRGEQRERVKWRSMRPPLGSGMV